MSTCLKQDICNLSAPGVFAADMQSLEVQEGLPIEVQYACLYWVQHVEKSHSQLSDDDSVHQFLKIHFLHWLEALSWLGKIFEGIHAIVSLESIARVNIYVAYSSIELTNVLDKSLYQFIRAYL
jgi:hypothetical protein